MEGGFTYLHATLSERGEQFLTKAPTMRYTISSYPLPDKGGTVANYGGCHSLPVAPGGKCSTPTRASTPAPTSATASVSPRRHRRCTGSRSRRSSRFPR